jgi:aryl-alcohol dehydrogenase-like predicted oxidoreductase
VVARKATQGGGPGGQTHWALWEQAQLDELRAAEQSRTAFLLRFALAHLSLHTTIVGTMNLAHLADNLRAADAGPLPPEVYAETRRRSETVRAPRTS